MKSLPSRRQFITSTTATVAAGFPFILRAGDSPNRKINVAGIGVGGMNGHLILTEGSEGFTDRVNFVAFADVDEQRAAKTFAKFPQVPRYRDFRKMLDKHGSEIDAVMIGTPDHTHFITAMAAVALGKHVFVQKPLCRTLWEVRKLQEAAREKGVVTQMGNQGHTWDTMRIGVEWIRGGVIGAVKEVNMWSNRPKWPLYDAPAAAAAVPEHLDWDLWLGPAAQRDYSPDYCPGKWRGWWDFGTGSLGDIGCHTLDLPFWALELGMPSAVHAETTKVSKHGTHTSALVTWEFPAKGDRGPVVLRWFDGGRMPERPAEMEKDAKVAPEGGSFVVGDKGSLYIPGMRPDSVRVVPEAKMRELALAKALPPKSIPRVKGGPVNEWLDAIEAGTQPLSNFEYAAPLTEVVLLGNLAMRSGERIEWDSEKLEVKGHPELEPLIKPTFREGWASGS